MLAPKPAYKPRSVQGDLPQQYRPWAIIYLERMLPCASSSLPGTQSLRATPCPCLALLPMGFAWPSPSPETPVCSYHTVSPSPAPRMGSPPLDGNIPLCCTMPSGHPAWPLASIVLCGARTFLDLTATSSTQIATAQPTWALSFKYTANQSVDTGIPACPDG